METENKRGRRRAAGREPDPTKAEEGEPDIDRVQEPIQRMKPRRMQRSRKAEARPSGGPPDGVGSRHVESRHLKRREPEIYERAQQNWVRRDVRRIISSDEAKFQSGRENERGKECEGETQVERAIALRHSDYSTTGESRLLMKRLEAGF